MTLLLFAIAANVLAAAAMVRVARGPRASILTHVHVFDDPDVPSRDWVLPAGRPGHEVVVSEEAWEGGYSVSCSYRKIGKE